MSQQPPTIASPLISPPSTTNEHASNAMKTATWFKAFVLEHLVMIIIVCILIVLGVVLTYLVLYYEPFRVMIGLSPQVDSIQVTDDKVVLPRDGVTTVKGRKTNDTVVTNNVATNKKKSHSKPKSKIPRPDPNPISPNDKEVFNIGNNIYTYEDAPAVCKALGARLATPEEVEHAWKRGADWCSYGWTEGQQALYPTQKTTYDKLQTSKEHAHDCGVVGVNGGYFENPELQFGVNCYGKKPEPRLEEKELIGYFPDYTSDKEKRLQERVAELRESIDSMTIMPYNREQWDENRTIMERVDDWMQSDKK